MKGIVEFINSNSDWLYIKIFENQIFFFDFWSFIHFWSGGVLITVISCSKLKRKWILLFACLLFYELVEIATLYLALNVFRPETIKDQLMDIFVGMAGGYLFDKWIRYFSSNRKQSGKVFQNPSLYIALFTAITIAFLWVGFYKYEYNISVFNSPGLNYMAFSIWVLGIFGIIIIYSMLSAKLKRIHALMLLWIIYVVVLCFLEFTFYHIIGFRESGNHDHKPLIFDIIHGTLVLHLFYLFLPFLSVFLYLSFNKLFSKAFFNVGKNNEYLNLAERYSSVINNEIPLKPAQITRLYNRIKRYFLIKTSGED